jgi:uncharacterized protein (TIGR00725 family)
MERPYVAVVGAGVCDRETYAAAEEVGRLLAESGAVIVCGGMTGVMEAACKGAKSAGGTTVGILPSANRADANLFVDIAIATGMGEMRNGLIVRSADVLIAIGGEWGTLSEISLALKVGRRVVGLRSWNIGATLEQGFAALSTPAEAVEAALAP